MEKPQIQNPPNPKPKNLKSQIQTHEFVVSKR